MFRIKEPNNDTKEPGIRALGAPIAYMVASSGFFMVMSALIKRLGPTYPLDEIVFCRSLFAFLPVLAMLRFAGGLAALRTRRPWNHIRRSAAGFTSMLLSFKALALLPLANATAIGFAAPLFTTALAVPLLGERVRPARWAAVTVGFAGILLMVPPEAGGSVLGAALALGGTFFSALAMIEIRRLGTAEPSITIVVYFMMTCMTASALALPFDAVMPSLDDAVIMVAMGAVGGLGQLCMTQAYRTAPASVVAPFNYASLLWALAFDFALWGNVPSWSILAGAVVVIGSGVFILLREAGPRPEDPAALGNPAAGTPR